MSHVQVLFQGVVLYLLESIIQQVVQTALDCHVSSDTGLRYCRKLNICLCCQNSFFNQQHQRSV